ncbi:PTS glucitol/sorbitol transporter subunit IIA [Halobacillus naozhouensis]|uniref:PTS glucitol/sorbitol transporter subunit IIA n=1 Tax=Halobacillus naozhouensis TaxID=554880 RepID=A0ABY8J2L4_9BACI|nr:PTS glucitol/sorbitol transporter subunit IIA [Halobacillus naozhouensis]WFT75638.1 PTS glucitol/sorbitol transporter subunit IIA [Halobacillus naozhouensis]
MSHIYHTKVTQLGPLANEFISEKIIILFKGDAPAELAEYCVLHKENQLEDQIKANDIFKINDREYEITGVGEAVYKNLNQLGHITLKFDGNTTPDLPGTLSLEDKEVPEIHEGDILEIIRN